MGQEADYVAQLSLRRRRIFSCLSSFTRYHAHSNVKERDNHVACTSLVPANICLILRSSIYIALMLNQSLYTLVLVFGIFFISTAGKRHNLRLKVFVWLAMVFDTAGTVMILMIGYQVRRISSCILSSSLKSSLLSRSYTQCVRGGI